MLKFLLSTLLTAPLLLKGWYVDNFIYHYTNTRWLGFTQVIANDAVLYCGILALLYVSVLPSVNRWLAASFRLAATIIFAIYIIDYIIIANFNTHLAVGDAIKYADYSFKYIQQIYDINSFGIAAFIAMVTGFILYLCSASLSITPTRPSKLPILFILSLPLASAFADHEKYAHAWIYKNVVDYNLTILSESSSYSDEFAKTVKFQDQADCQTNPPESKNIILVMVESLSAYQSRYFSGINDWTPNIDAIAERHLAFKNFYANGFITEDGEIALLTGLPAIYPPSTYTDDGGTSFFSFYQVADSLPNILKKYRYKSEFLTTADLEFGNTGVWAKSIGFDYVEGHDNPEYDHWERFHFQAAPDEALYIRAIDRIRKNRNNPFFLFIKTVSSHHPYINPENKEKSESAAIVYTDKQLGRFYRQLQDSHFFNDGLLIIVGDHHSLTPLRKAEVDLYGAAKATARIPLIIASGDAPAGVENRQFQQTDVFNSLQSMVSGRQCHSDWNGLLLGASSIAPKYILHRRGDNRDMVSVFTDSADYFVKLDGDQTRVVGKQPLAPNSRQLLVDKINALRLTRADWAVKKSAETSN